jgi:hypothetical protein
MDSIRENDNDNDGSDLDPKDDGGIIKKFLIEIVGKFKTSSTLELSNYEEALELFNQRSKEGKNPILYEIHKSINDGSIVKKVPVLNTYKHAERMRIREEELKKSNTAINGTVNAPTSTSTSSSPDQKSKTTLGTMKFKIIILAATVAGFILLLFILDIIAGGGSGNMSGHLVAFEGLQTYLQTARNIHYDLNYHYLISVYFLL